MDAVSTDEAAETADEQRLPRPGPRTPEERERIAARYPARRRWPFVALGIVLGVLLGTWTLWTALYHANPAVSAQVLSFQVVSDSEVRLVLHVDRPDPSVAGVCTVIAQSENYQQVGELDVQLAPGTTRLVDVPVTLRTIARATSASLQSCRAAS